ncbi:hypothetical protein LSM04_004085 [Trypanosoma melophagium]|uniref:uncharacterized protein n=1 Tax=Trypanosoma melophagium TaxID=715481 RepID=UPI00351A6193|nr:hypothetical protein LSM04_004085 [Trypanosoma melophagium]
MGGAPSRESTTLYSYFRGTYEIGLIPLTKKFFGRPGNAEDPAAAQWASTMELRRQFVHMRSDPAIVYANARKTVMATWPELMSNTFTEEDLDLFLEKVEAGLYNTDAEMVEDSQRALVPVPCALCLACKEGQERSGCFMWNGRNIVVIGYFGCMEEEARSAFGISKGVISPSAQIPPATGTAAVAGGIISSADGGSSECTHPPDVDMESVKLFLSAAVLASAGDRTLERVLLLASVMLRNQYLDAATRLRYQRGGNPFGLNNTVEMGGTELGATSSSTSVSFSLQQMMSLSDYTFCNSNPAALQARDEALEVLKNRLRHLIVYVEAAVDNYSSLKSLTENVAFLQCQTTVDPAMCVLELPEIVFEEKEPETLDVMKIGGKSAEEVHQQEANVITQAEGQKSNEEGTSNISAQQESVTGTAATTQEEKNVHDVKSEATEKKEITPTLEGGETEKEKQPVQGDENSEKLKKHTIDRNAPVELIRLHFGPSYAVEAFMWGAGLLTAPSHLNTGGWIQYKLKDESEELRQTLHSKDSIVAKWREECKDIASRYMGNNTDVLLRHVRRLQNEVERARGVPLQDWPIDNLIQTREGRTCALHHTTIGTMLVGIRNRREGDAARKQERRKANSREMNDRMGNTDNVLHCMGSHDPRSRLCVAMAGQPNTPTLGKSVGTMSSTSGTSHETGGTNMNAFAAFHGMGRMGPAPMYTQPPAGYPPQFSFIPQMQPSPGLAMGANFIPAPMMMPCYPTPAADNTSMERKTQQESSPSIVPTTATTTMAPAGTGTALPASAAVYHPQPQQQIPPGFVLETSGDVMARNFAGGNINVARGAGDGSTFVPSQLPLPSNTNLQAPPYTYSYINPVAASPGGNFLTTAMPTAAPQQQLMMLQQGPGGMQVLVPIGSAPPAQHYPLPPPPQQQQPPLQPQQTPSFLPTYAFSQGAVSNTHVIMAPSQPVGAVPTWNAAQPNTGGVAVSGAGGMSNVMYYLPTQ